MTFKSPTFAPFKVTKKEETEASEFPQNERETERPLEVLDPSESGQEESNPDEVQGEKTACESLLDHFVDLLQEMCQESESDAKFYGIKKVPAQNIIQRKSKQLEFDGFMDLCIQLGISERSPEDVTSVKRFNDEIRRRIYFDKDKCECLFFMRNQCNIPM